MESVRKDLDQVVELLGRLSLHNELLCTEQAALRGACGAVQFVRSRFDPGPEGRMDQVPERRRDWREAQLPVGDRT